jgi:hypothetical protein
MDGPETHELTQLLLAWDAGDEAAFNQLAPLVHAELRRLAIAPVTVMREWNKGKGVALS